MPGRRPATDGEFVLKLLLLCGLVTGGGAVAVGQVSTGGQAGKPTVVTAAPPKPQQATDKKVPVLSRGITLRDFAEMEPKAEIKNQLTEVDGFIQSAPSDGLPGTQKTVAWIGRTSTALYVVFACYDSDPAAIRGHLARRENILTDDNVSVLLDTFQDHRRGILFQTNAAGVQADAAWTEGNGTDYSYDQVWDSDGEVTSKGWMALFAIPFKSLRFRPDAQDWGVVLQRNFPRNSETDSWPHIATSITGTLPQEGTLLGITGVTGSHNIQLNPYMLGQNVHALNGLNPLDPYFSTRNAEATGGGEVKAVVKDSIVLDATVNPDFSDIESDQPQFTVNQRYPVYFPELRPFFLENANYFTTPIDLLYTRNIVRPVFGVRATGKIGGTNIGILLADDRGPGETFATSDPDFGKKALFGVGRVTQDLGKGSSLGLMYTDYEFAGSWNRIGGVDFTWRMNEKWTATGQMVESSTKNVNGTLLGSGDEGSGDSYSAGPASTLSVSRQGHAWNLQNEFDDYSTGFQSAVGFIQTTDYYHDQEHSTYQWYPKHSFVQSIGLENNQQVAYDHQGNRIYHYSQFDPFFTLKGNTVIAPIGGENSDTVGPQDGYALSHSVNFTENYGGFVVRSAPLRQLNLNIVGLRSGNVNYNPPANNDVPFLLDQQTLQALVSVLPLHNVTIDNTYLLDRDHNAHTNADVYESQTFRTKINYQFTKALSARTIVEYDSVLANPLETSLQRTKHVSTEALLTWLPHPGTAVYVGYNNDIQNIDRALCNRLPDGDCDPNNTTPPVSRLYLNDGRQFFVKASYLLRF
ncbi:hypothetical protein GOB94_05565 [Granulicella sp. 5B5]|uniref:carbohydrate binding family 9 domain-containing protein n=1 Tax=Granulicella sp. 5B5 TaxID=1617967 RepID=UPI0015F6668C|nr:carbohydrate binding family 9 domain-containing protein [Granulicella sp. 5B5]QMV18219.1 hypothetical protein GOB94_05565 [Granulicella sp. 5B5]